MNPENIEIVPIVYIRTHFAVRRNNMVYLGIFTRSGAFATMNSAIRFCGGDAPDISGKRALRREEETDRRSL